MNSNSVLVTYTVTVEMDRWAYERAYGPRDDNVVSSAQMRARGRIGASVREKVLRNDCEVQVFDPTAPTVAGDG